MKTGDRYQTNEWGEVVIDSVGLGQVHFHSITTGEQFATTPSILLADRQPAPPTDDSPTPEGWPPPAHLDESESDRVVVTFYGAYFASTVKEAHPTAVPLDEWIESTRRWTHAHYRTTRECELEKERDALDAECNKVTDAAILTEEKLAEVTRERDGLKRRHHDDISVLAFCLGTTHFDLRAMTKCPKCGKPYEVPTAPDDGEPYCPEHPR